MKKTIVGIAVVAGVLAGCATPTPAPTLGPESSPTSAPSPLPTVSRTDDACVRASSEIHLGEMPFWYPLQGPARDCYGSADEFLTDIGLSYSQFLSGTVITFWTQQPVDSEGMLIPPTATPTPTATATVGPANDTCVRATIEIPKDSNPSKFIRTGPASGCYAGTQRLFEDIGLSWGEFEPGLEITFWTQWPTDETGAAVSPTPTATPRPTATPIGGMSGSLRIGDVTSRYQYSNLYGPLPERIPVIIFVGHQMLKERPTARLSQFKDLFDEPVLLIRSGVLDDFTTDWCYFGPDLCHGKVAQFVTLVQYYTGFFPIDENRIYLTGFSCDSVYAHIFAYAHPELFAGVVAMSSNTYSFCFQENLDSAAEVVTVVVKGELDETYRLHLALEEEHGRTIESLNPNSRWIIKRGETHASVVKYWLENLRYIMQFSK